MGEYDMEEYHMGEYDMGEYHIGEYHMGEYHMGEYDMGLCLAQMARPTHTRERPRGGRGGWRWGG